MVSQIIRDQGSPVRRLSAVISVLALGGCTTIGMHSTQISRATHRSPNSSQQVQREAALGSLWRGKSHDLLLKSLGPPKMVMNVPGNRPLPNMALVYGVVDEAAQCVDAFTMVKSGDTGQWLVADYFCR